MPPAQRVRKRIALVAPRCSESTYGGAEVLAMRLASDLTVAYDVEILTTCAQDYRSWENAYPEGTDTCHGVAIRRFAVDAPRDMAGFNYLSRALRYRAASLSVQEEERWMREQGPYSTSFLRFLTGRGTEYDAYVFMPYLYATTYFGLPIVRSRSILLPLAHDEWPLYFSAWRHFFEEVRSFVFVAAEEAELLRRRFHGRPLSGEVVHPGIVRGLPPCLPPARADAERLSMLYLGRMDEAKGIDELRDVFLAHVAEFPRSPWRLIFAGPCDEQPDDSEHIAYVGALDDAAKWRLLLECDLFVMPSYQESLSIALLEAWWAERAALVNGWNPVLVGQVRRANGGLWYYDQRSFDAALAALNESTRGQLGYQGRAFVERTYAVGDTVGVFERAIARLG